jgi:hypothetical protein
MLANGVEQAGVSIYFVNEKIDAGELCGQDLFRIDSNETLDRSFGGPNGSPLVCYCAQSTHWNGARSNDAPSTLLRVPTTAGRMRPLCVDSSLPDGVFGKDNVRQTL